MIFEIKSRGVDGSIVNISRKKRAADLLEMFDFSVDLLFRYFHFLCKTRFAKIFFGVAVDQSAVDRDLIGKKPSAALHTEKHYFTLTSWARKTRQSPAAT